MVRLTKYFNLTCFGLTKTFFRMMSFDLFSLICDLGTLIMAVLVLYFSLTYLREASSWKFWVLVIPSPGSDVMDTEYKGEATVSMNCSLSSYKLTMI